MKKVVKISIGNLAFTVEQEAYYAIKGYLEEVQDYYENVENNKEILEGIEERMAELFVEKCGVGGVVSLSVVNDVADILGRPEVFAEESDVRPSGFENTKGRVPKKLYRDPDNKVLGGVCSGLAAYFAIDVTLVRVLYVIFFFGFSFLGIVHLGAPSFLLLAYIIMWLVIPEARTVEQKCAMYGESPDLSNIQRKMQRELSSAGRSMRRAATQHRGSIGVLGRIIGIIVAVVFLVVSLTGIGSITFFVAGIEVFEEMVPVDLFNYIEMGTVNPLFFKIVVLSFILLPFVGLLYLAVKLLFHFRTPRIRPGLILFLLWIISFVGIIYLSVNTSRPYWNEANYKGEIELSSTSDTLYIDFEYAGEIPEDAVYYRAGHSRYEIFWMDQQNKSIVMFPSIRLVRQSEEESRVIKYKTTAFAKSYQEAVSKSKKRTPGIAIGDSLITILPELYDKLKKFDGTHHEIYIYLPEDVEVQVRKPLEHNFDEVIVSEWPFDGCHIVSRF